MFGMGAGELILILVIALLIFGPKKLPELAKGIGKALREFRRASSDLQEQLSIDQDLGPAVREVQAAAAGAPSPAELAAARRAYDVRPDAAAVPADDHALDEIKAAAAARVAAEPAAEPVEAQASKPAIEPAPPLDPAPSLDARPAIAPTPAPPAGGETPAKG